MKGEERMKVEMVKKISNAGVGSAESKQRRQSNNNNKKRGKKRENGKEGIVYDHWDRRYGRAEVLNFGTRILVY